MDRLSDTRSLGSGRSRNKPRLPLPSQQSGLIGEEIDLLSQFSDSQPSKSSKGKRLPLPSQMGDNLGSDLLSSLVSTDSNFDLRSNPSKRSTNRKKLPLPSDDANCKSLLGEFMEPSSSASLKSNLSNQRHGLAPNFPPSNQQANRKPSLSLLDEVGQQDLLERLSSLSSKSAGSNSKKSANGSKAGQRRNLPRPSDLGNGKREDDLLAMFSTQVDPDVAETYETIVYDPDAADPDENEDFFDESGGGNLSPRDVINQASDVLSLLSGHEGGVRPSVLTNRGHHKYSDDDSKSSSTGGSRDRPASKVSGTGYISDKSSMMSGNNRGVTASLTNSMGEGRQWNQNRAYFLRTAELRKRNERKPNSPLNKFLPGGSMSSTAPRSEPDSVDTELIEQLQLELEEARRTIRSHEGKILALQDEVEAARESCMEEECERVEAEILKDRVHNENRMLKSHLISQVQHDRTLKQLKVQLTQLESIQSSTGSDGTSEGRRRPLSAVEPMLSRSSIAIQTDQERIRTVKSMGDVIKPMGEVRETLSLEQLEEGAAENILSEVVSLPIRPLSKSQSAITFNELGLNQLKLNELSSIQEEADGLLIPLKDSSKQIAIPFRKKTVGYKVSIISHWLQSLVLRESDFSGSLYKETA